MLNEFSLNKVTTIKYGIITANKNIQIVFNHDLFKPKKKGSVKSLKIDEKLELFFPLPSQITRIQNINSVKIGMRKFESLKKTYISKRINIIHIPIIYKYFLFKTNHFNIIFFIIKYFFIYQKQNKLHPNL